MRSSGDLLMPGVFSICCFYVAFLLFHFPFQAEYFRQGAAQQSFFIGYWIYYLKHILITQDFLSVTLMYQTASSSTNFAS